MSVLSILLLVFLGVVAWFACGYVGYGFRKAEDVIEFASKPKNLDDGLSVQLFEATYDQDHWEEAVVALLMGPLMLLLEWACMAWDAYPSQFMWWNPLEVFPWGRR